LGTPLILASICLFLLKIFDAIHPRKGSVTRAMSKRLQEDWVRAVEEGPRVLMNLRVDF